MSKSRKTRRQGKAERKVQFQDVVALRVACSEGRDILTPGQYEHVKDLLKQLVGFGSQTYDQMIRIEPFGDFWKFKEKGGVLGKINLRVYFAHVKSRNEVVLLLTYKKEDDGKVGSHMRIRLANRLRQYLAGELSVEVTYTRRE